MAALTTGTTSRHRYVVYENWLGSKIVDYHFVVSWTYNGRNVVGAPTSYTYLKNAVAGVRNDGIISNKSVPQQQGHRHLRLDCAVAGEGASQL